MLTLRKRLFIIIGLISGLVIAFLLGYYLLFNKPTNEPTGINTDVIGGQNIDNQTGNQGTGPGSTVPTVVENKPVDMSIYAKQVARIFVERFATYSNQNNNQNIDDVLSMSTPVMVRWLESQRGNFEPEYQGITTSVVASQIISIDDTMAVVEVNTQQQVMTVSGMELKQKTGKVELIKEDSDWKVNGFYWDKN